jgi:hypothetical protein
LNRVVAKQEIQEVLSAKRAGVPYAHHRNQAEKKEHRPKWVGYFTGAINVDSVLKSLPREEIASAWKTPEGSSPKALSVSIALKSDPAWDESESGVGRREKIISALV